MGVNGFERPSFVPVEVRWQHVMPAVELSFVALPDGVWEIQGEQAVRIDEQAKNADPMVLEDASQLKAPHLTYTPGGIYL